jgi:hypothetical protein
MGAYDELAQKIAKEAHEKNFSSRRGLLRLSEKRVCYYDNNPWRNDLELEAHGVLSIRGAMLNELRHWMAAEGIAEIGFGSYPVAGDEDAGYTFALILATNDFVAVEHKLDSLLQNGLTKHGPANDN